jgi:hypothetical protein
MQFHNRFVTSNLTHVQSAKFLSAWSYNNETLYRALEMTGITANTICFFETCVYTGNSQEDGASQRVYVLKNTRSLRLQLDIASMVFG